MRDRRCHNNEELFAKGKQEVITGIFLLFHQVR
jgi:hypothetical protein